MTTPSTPSCPIVHLGPQDLQLMHDMNTLFGEVFDDAETYCTRRPRPDYLERLLGRDSFVALAAVRADTGEPVGALAAYELHKFEQERSEFYLYDLAVAETHRRQGLATALIRALQAIAAERGASVVFVQADTTAEDAAAIALYSKLGTAEAVLHFDLEAPGP